MRSTVLPAYWILLIGILALTGGGYLVEGPGGLILVYMAAVPVGLWLAILGLGKEGPAPTGLMVFYFLAGCSISIVVATILESVSQLSSIRIWSCEARPNVSWQCNAAFSLSLLVSIGLVEEFSKALPVLMFTRLNEDHIPRTNRRLYWVVESPAELVLAGCASGGGFACIENIKYVVFSASSLQEGFDTSLVRAVLAIPFHIACSGIVAALYAEALFTTPTVSLESAPPPRPNITTRIWSNLRRLVSAQRPSAMSDAASPLLETARLTSSLSRSCIASPTAEPSQCRPPRGLLGWVFRLFSLSVLCHTGYDLSLFLAAQSLAAGPTALSLCAATYLVSYSAALLLFLKKWNEARRASRSAIARLHPHLDLLL